MKKFFVFVLIMLLTFTVTNATAEDRKSLRARIVNMTNEQKEARMTQIEQRVLEIKNIDKSTLSKTERKALKNELKDIRQEAKAIGRGGIYISFAGLIIIVLLLILLL